MIFKIFISDLLFMRIPRPGKQGLYRSLHAVQPIRLQAEFPRDVRAERWTSMRGGWELHGQCQVLRILRVSLPANCKYCYCSLVSYIFLPC